MTTETKRIDQDGRYVYGIYGEDDYIHAIERSIELMELYVKHGHEWNLSTILKSREELTQLSGIIGQIAAHKWAEKSRKENRIKQFRGKRIKALVKEGLSATAAKEVVEEELEEDNDEVVLLELVSKHSYNLFKTTENMANAMAGRIRSYSPTGTEFEYGQRLDDTYHTSHISPVNTTMEAHKSKEKIEGAINQLQNETTPAEAVAPDEQPMADESEAVIKPNTRRKRKSKPKRRVTKTEVPFETPVEETPEEEEFEEPVILDSKDIPFMETSEETEYEEEDENLDAPEPPPPPVTEDEIAADTKALLKEAEGVEVPEEEEEAEFEEIDEEPPESSHKALKEPDIELPFSI